MDSMNYQEETEDVFAICWQGGGVHNALTFMTLASLWRRHIEMPGCEENSGW